MHNCIVGLPGTLSRMLQEASTCRRQRKPRGHNKHARAVIKLQHDCPAWAQFLRGSRAGQQESTRHKGQSAAHLPTNPDLHAQSHLAAMQQAVKQTSANRV